MVAASRPARASNRTKPQYRPRQPAKGALFEILADHLETFFVWHPQRYKPRMGHLRAEVRSTLEEFLSCGIHRAGLARVVCPNCHREDLLPLSCQRRGLCASCHAKRQLVLVERTLEELLCGVPCRQWTFSLPKALRCYFRFDGSLFKQMSRIVVRELTQFIRHLCGRDDLEPGFVVFDQTFGSLPDTFHPHQHICATQGGFTPAGRFIPLPKIHRRDVAAVCEVLRHRVIAWLVKRGKLSADFGRCMLGWEHSGFSLYASRSIEAGQTNSLQHLLMYMARHPFNPQAIEYDRTTGQVTYRTSTQRSGTRSTVLKTTAVEFIAFLAQHIPHFGRHQVRFYGAATPKVRKRLSLKKTPTSGKKVPRNIANRGRRSWSKWIWKVWGFDPLLCPRCGTQRRILSILFQDEVIRKILNHLGLETQRPRIRPARAPPELDPGHGHARDPCPEYDLIDPDHSRWDCLDEEPDVYRQISASRPPERRNRPMGILEILERVPGLVRASELKGARPEHGGSMHEGADLADS